MLHLDMANVTCAMCGERVVRRRGARYCSNKCRQRANRIRWRVRTIARATQEAEQLLGTLDMGGLFEVVDDLEPWRA